MPESGVGRFVGPIAMLILGGLAGTFLVMHKWGTAAAVPTPVVKGPASVPKGPAPEEVARLKQVQDQQEANREVVAGDAAMAKGDFDTAIGKYRRAQELDPNNPRAVSGLRAARTEEEFRQTYAKAQEFKTAGQLEEARTALTKALALKPDHADALVLQNGIEHDLLMRQGEEAERKRDWNMALDCYRKAKALLAARGVEDKAAEAAQHRVEVSDRVQVQDARRKEFRDRFNAAEALERAGKLTEAIEAYGQTVSLTDSPADVQDRIEKCKAKLRDNDALYKSFVDRGDKAAEAGKPGEAKSYYERALQVRPNDAVVLQKVAGLSDKASVLDMVLIPAGEYQSGTGNGGPPAKKIRLKAFYLDKKEVTNLQYVDFLLATPTVPLPRGWKDRQIPAKGAENMPVMGVSADDAAAYARWAGKRLPTEEEWEYAARGSDGRLFPWGNDFDKEKCNTMEKGKQGPLPVGSFGEVQSPSGCFDMAGNVAEWTATAEMREVQDPDGQLRSVKFAVLKGGSFLLPQSWARITARFLENPKLRLPGNGFRCAKDAQGQ